MAKNIKGVDIRWGQGIFPEYRDISGPIVSKKRINRLKPIVKNLLIVEEDKILNAFKTLARKRYRGKTMMIKIDIPYALNRVDTVVLATDNEDIYGETDGYTIWISSIKMSDEILLGTMLHEALHGLVTFNKKGICEKDEHYCMSILGDDC